jgi:hypothetical protein
MAEFAPMGLSLGFGNHGVSKLPMWRFYQFYDNSAFLACNGF